MAIANPAIWRPNTRQWVLAELLLEAGFTRETPETEWRAIRSTVRKAVEPDPEVRAKRPSSLSTDLRIGTGILVFKGQRIKGVSASYGVLDINDQGKRCWYVLGDIMKAIAEYGWDREAGIRAASEEAAETPAEPVQIKPTGFDPVAEMKFFLGEVRRIRDWLKVNDPEGEIDHISYRPVEDGRAMIEQGIPARACLHAMAMHWERADRQRAGIRDYDPATEFPGGLHAYLDALVKSRVLIMLTGPAGMGKSYWTKSLAQRLYGADWKSKRAQIPCSEGMSPSWFVGKDLRSGFAESKFQRIWREGGIINLDEMDRSDSNILTLINDALANDLLDNPVERAEHERHADTIIVAATNTLGFGADDKYVGANQLDFSTIDRFRMGRAYVGYDRAVEDLIAFA